MKLRFIKNVTSIYHSNYGFLTFDDNKKLHVMGNKNQPYEVFVERGFLLLLLNNI